MHPPKIRATSHSVKGNFAGLTAFSAISLAYTVALVLTYSFLTLKALLQFAPDWDYLAYHLPGILRWAGYRNYTAEHHLVEVIRGFPPLSYILSGTMVRLFGRLSLANSHNAIIFLGCAFALRWLFRDRIDWKLFFLLLLAVPLFVLHFPSGYVDLASGSLLMLTFASFWRTLEEPTKVHRFALLLSVALAMLSKFQAWPTVACIIGALCLVAVRQRELRSTVVLLVLVASPWPARNFLLFGNPTYPFQPPLLQTRPGELVIPNAGQPKPPFLRVRANTYGFFISAFEVNRLLSDEPYEWSLDQASPLGIEGAHNRLGGWFFGTTILLLVGGLVAAFRRFVPLPVSLSFVAAIGAVSVLPPSQELRYWLFIPLTLALFTACAAGNLTSGWWGALHAMALLCVTHVFLHLPRSVFVLDPQPVSAYAPPEAQQFWLEADSGVPVNICGKLPNTIFWTGPEFASFEVRACY